MPVMNAQCLRPEIEARWPKMQILPTNGYSESEVRRLAAAHPGAAFIQKPYTI